MRGSGRSPAPLAARHTSEDGVTDLGQRVDLEGLVRHAEIVQHGLHLQEKAPSRHLHKLKKIAPCRNL